MPATLNRTTIAAALSAGDTTVRFASAMNINAGDLAYIDREAMRLLLQPFPAVPTIWKVMRGVSGTSAAPHAVNNQIYTGPPGLYAAFSPQGFSTLDAVVALPHINITTGDRYLRSSGGSWQKVGSEGVPAQQAWASGSVAIYTAAGAIAIQPGSVEIVSGTACAMTLASPAQVDDGTVMTIFGVAPSGAHTVTTPAGFNGGGTAMDVATYSLTGGTLTIQAINGKWRVLSSNGVTFA